MGVKFEVTAPNGKVYEVNGPEGSTQADAINYVKNNINNLSEIKKSEWDNEDKIGNMNLSQNSQLAKNRQLQNKVFNEAAFGSRATNIPTNAGEMLQRQDPVAIGQIGEAAKIVGGKKAQEYVNKQYDINPNDPRYKLGEFTTDIAVSTATPAAMGGVASKIPALAKYAPVISSMGGELGPAQTSSKLANTLLKMGAGAATGAASSGIINPEDAESGALIGAAFPAAGVLGSVIGKSQDELNFLKSVNAPKQKTLEQSIDVGYTIPRSTYNPSATMDVLETLGGKTATQQQASIANQEVTNKLARQYIGLPENTPLSKEVINTAKQKASTPYVEAALLPKGVVGQTSTRSMATGQTVARDVEKSGEQLVDEIKTAKDNARSLWQDYISPNQTNRTEKFNQYVNAKEEVSRLENQLEKLAQLHNKPDLVNNLKTSRQRLAKIHSIEDALNENTGNVSALDLLKQQDRNEIFSDEAKKITDFASAFPADARPAEKVSNPNVRNMLTGGGSMAGAYVGNAFGGPIGALLGAAAPFVVPPTARKIALSKALQKLPSYKQSMVRTMMEQSPKANPLAIALYELNNEGNK